MENKTNVYKKIHAVMSELGNLTKDGSVSIGGRGGYQYTTEYNFISSIQPLLIKHGLIIFPLKVEQNTQVVQTDSKTAYFTTGHAVYRIADIESGEFVDGEMVGSGIDSGDKSVYKNLTGIFKYFLRQTLFIASGGDDAEASDSDDNDTSSTPPIALAASKYKEITGSPFTKDMLQQLSKAGYVTTNGFGVEENNTAKAIVKIANGVKSGKKFEELIVSK